MNEVPRRRLWKSLFAIAAASAATGAQAANSFETLRDVCGDCVAVRYARCGGFLEGPSLGADGSLWLTDVVGGRILQVDRSGTCKARVTGQKLPNGTQVRADGKLVVSHAGGLLLLDPATAALEPLPVLFGGKPVTGINDLAIAPDGAIYFTAPGRSSLAAPDGSVYYMSPAGDVRKLGGNYAFPNGLELTRDGEAVLVANFAAKEVISLPAITAKSPFATTYLLARTEGGIGPDGMRTDKKGRLFVANLGAGNVLVYDALARPIGEIRLPANAGTMVTNVAVGPDYLYITEASKGEIWHVRLRAAR